MGIAELAFGQDAQVQQLRRRLCHLPIPLQISARGQVLALIETQLGHLVQGRRVGRIAFKSTQQVIFRLVIQAGLPGAGARIGQGNPGRLIEGILKGLVKIGQRRLILLQLAQIAAIGIQRIGILRVHIQGTAVGSACRIIFPQGFVDQRQYQVGISVTLSLGNGFLGFLQCRGVIALAQVFIGQLHIDIRCLIAEVVVSQVPDAGIILPLHQPLVAAPEQQEQHGQTNQSHEASPRCWRMRRDTSVRPLRSRTLPTSWPQAASISSPRVLRRMVMMPAFRSF